MKICNAHACTQRLAELLRVLSLSILFAGSAAIVFAAITLVKTAVAQGIASSQAATANAPVFIHFSKIMLTAGLVLLASEALDYLQCRTTDNLKRWRYLSSVLCATTTMIFSLGIVPPMAELMPLIRNQSCLDPAAAANVHASFHRLHEISRIFFAGTIFFSLISLVIPIFSKPWEASFLSAPPTEISD